MSKEQVAQILHIGVDASLKLEEVGTDAIAFASLMVRVRP